MKASLFLVFAALTLITVTPSRGRDPEDSGNATDATKRRVLIFSGTGWYRHPQIPELNGWLVRLGAQNGIQADVTETGNDITPQRLATYDVLVMNNSNELVKLLDEKQRRAIEQWYAKGGGIVGLHAVLVHQTEWQWFREMAGCDFDSDSDFLEARVVVDPAAMNHPAVKGLGKEFRYKADWTNHTKTVTGLAGVQVLLRVDETTYTPVRQYFVERNGKPMGNDHPIAWTREWGGGRFFYTEFGHSIPSLDTQFGRQHILAALHWAAGEKWKPK